MPRSHQHAEHHTRKAEPLPESDGVLIGEPPTLEPSGESGTASDRVDRTESADLGNAVSLWFERGLVIACAAVVAFGAVGLLLAVLGHYKVLVVFPLGAAGTLAGALIAWPRRSSGRSGAATLPAIGMCLVAVCFALWNAAYASHHVAIGRDPGVYTDAGKWLAVHGDLQVPTSPEWRTEDASVPVTMPGIYPEGDHLEFQFNHLTPVLFAEADNLGGDRLMFRVTTVLGTLALCAIYAVGCRLTRRPWLTLAAVTALAVALPQLNASRDTYSEPTVQFLLWAGIYLLIRAYEQRRFGVALLAGAALGGTMMGRVDALVYLIPLPLVGAVAWIAAGTQHSGRSVGRVITGVACGAVPLAVLGTIDARTRAGTYYTDLGSEIGRLQAAFVASTVAAVVVALVARLCAGRFGTATAWIRQHRPAIALVGASVTGLGLVLAWTLRPVLSHPTGTSNELVQALQAAAGLPSDPGRSYAEYTLRWFSWYLGPVTVGLAILGVAILIIRSGRRVEPAVGIVLPVAGIGTALYLWKPSIVPDQIWAMRRFVPAGLPLFVVLAAVGLAGIIPVAASGRARPRWAGPAAAVAAIAIIGFPLAVSIPVRNFQPQAGYLAAVNQVCQRVGPSGAVLFVAGDTAEQQLAGAVRSWCNVPVGIMTQPMSASELDQLATSWRADRRELWALSSTPRLMSAVGRGLTPDLVTTATSPHELEMTINRPPQYYARMDLPVWAARVSG